MFKMDMFYWAQCVVFESCICATFIGVAFINQAVSDVNAVQEMYQFEKGGIGLHLVEKIRQDLGIAAP